MASGSSFISTNEINTFTNRKLRKLIIDQRFGSAPTLGVLRATDRLIVEDGGSIVVQPVLSQINQTAQSYSGADALNITVQEEFTNAEIQWKQASVSATITGIDKAKNSGTSQQLNLVKNKVEAAYLALFNLIAGFVYADGTGNGGKDFDGFLGAINNSGGFNTYLGIDRSANTWWQAQTLNAASAALSYGNMLTLFLNCRTDEEIPNFITCTNAGYQQYETLLIPGERYVDDKVGGLGFSNICFQGQPMVIDSHAPTGNYWFFNLDHCRLMVHKDENFRFVEFQNPPAQDILVARVQTYGNFYCDKPASCGVLQSVANA